MHNDLSLRTRLGILGVLAVLILSAAILVAYEVWKASQRPAAILTRQIRLENLRPVDP